MVLVTGASGFVAKHCIVQLLDLGYRVRGTLRSPSREVDLRNVFEEHTQIGDRLDFVNADLMNHAGWSDAVNGCLYVLHVASPFPSNPPKHEDDLIVPAREGTLRILKTAARANVRRVVMTSSIVAVSYGHDYDSSKVFDENDWSKIEAIGAYEKSKTLAERAAWDFVNSLEGKDRLELAVINPGMVLGPILDDHYSTSGEVVRKLMRREYPGCPKLYIPAVDVRDVAAAHISAMATPGADGKRFCCVAQCAWMREIAEILNNHFSAQGYKIPTRELPNFIVRFVSLFDKTARLIVGNLGKRSEISNKLIKQVLDWEPRALEEMAVAMGQSMIEYGVV
jgi:nucleoside-diphosphate-sugar epimerase